MAYKLTKIQLRRDTAENWSSVNPPLLPGELGYDTTNKYIKINYNTESANWNDLSTIHIPVSAVDGLSAVDANTIYDLSNVTDAGFTLVSANALQEVKTWAPVNSFTAKSWADEIEASKEEAKAYSDDQLSAHIKKMHVHDDVEIIEGTASKGKYCNIVANGIPVIVKQGATEDTIDVWYDNDTKKVTVDRTAYPGGVSLFGGCGNEDDDPTYLPATSIRIESGKLTAVFAGSMNAGNVGIANVTMNGGEITSGIAGGRSDGSQSIPATKKHYNNIGILNITVNGGKATMVYGGSNGYSTVDRSNITVNGGTIGYLTAGGANGDVLDAHVKVNGGIIDVYQAVNRGIVCAAELTLNGGTIKTCYAGGETTDKTVNGRYYKSSLLLLGGRVNSLQTGTNGGTVDSSLVSGKYAEGIYDDADIVIDKLEKISAFGNMAYKDAVIDTDLSGLFNFDCGNALNVINY